MLTGWKGDSDFFRFDIYDTIQPRAIVDVLRGRRAGVLFRGCISPETCATLTERFWSSTARKKRGADAPGFYLGAYHYHKPTAQYLDECEAIAAPLTETLDVPAAPLAAVRAALASELAKDGVTLRLAQHEGRNACPALMRSWHGGGIYALTPHDDRAQCTEPQQADFEIQRAANHHVAALNMCVENGDGKGGGRLAYWNMQPDEACKRKLGTHYSGLYTPEMVTGLDVLWVDVNPGDVYFFNGACVHAVEPNTDPTTRRTTIAGLYGFIDDRTVVSWT